ncbi:trans-aconitate 2-methyltransferase [Kibdelosporangium phytohabitans]|uniref:Trans-aconitate methyltransferase n=1 Tax=Kibdelosporangium phytohabitans TaxID=860235 RepID=A0A0N9HZ16_9PSEU|nr:trans-aconitate 2-methyltransferase [Kibdelosporangium phytohabitans]ALG07573.1 trans-aconitate methyltransferase [Kibdelosporangium phytohabitans]MBE1471486.1 trans-aconitate 2-methyltransferase [Kibdelosporangium phytohabitans]
MWDPDKYLTFADHRARPFYELIARIQAESPRRVVDLGCGPGNLTTALARRWPDAAIEAIDSSPEMVDAAKKRGITAHVGDVGTWKPQQDTDVVVTNAVLQWVPEHPKLLRRWTKELPSGAWIAMQVPGNFDGPSHNLIRELVTRSWSTRLADVDIRPVDAVLTPTGYADLFDGCDTDTWETTYTQILTGADPVLEWVTGTALRPIKAALTGDEWTQFRADLAPALREAYPRRADGRTWFPFRRVFAVVRVS